MVKRLSMVKKKCVYSYLDCAILLPAPSGGLCITNVFAIIISSKCESRNIFRVP